MNGLFLKKYIVKPFQLLSKNWTIFFLFFIFLIISKIDSKYSNIDLKINSAFAYNDLPSAILSLITNKLTVSILIACFLFMSYLIVCVSKDMMLIFTRSRKSLLDSIKNVTFREIIWFLKFEFFVYLIFGIIALLFYGLTFFIWKITDLTILPLIILGSAFALLYPVFYAGLSLGLMLCVLPLSSLDKYKKIKYFAPFKIFSATYLFYATRLSIEYAFIIVLPFISIYFFKNYYWADGFVLFGLMLPLLLLRGAAYEFKLSVLSKDLDIKKIFQKHFDSNSSLAE